MSCQDYYNKGYNNYKRPPKVFIILNDSQIFEELRLTTVPLSDNHCSLNNLA